MGNMLITAVLVSLLPGGLQTPHPHRTITIKVTFDYDFRITPACSAKVTQGCVQRFNLYEVSLGISKRAKLLSIPVPAGASGFERHFRHDRTIFIRLRATQASCFGADAQRAGIGFERVHHYDHGPLGPLRVSASKTPEPSSSSAMSWSNLARWFAA